MRPISLRMRGAVMSLNVLRTTLLRRTPCKPRRCINLSNAQRAMAKPSRFICSQTLSAPQTRMLANQTRAMCGTKVS